MSSLLTRSSIAANPVYAFGGVELDKTNHVLRVDGNVRACPELIFRFLSLLCESPHQLILRDELIDHLWPGGQVISDEAITQVLFRARSILGPYGSQIKTVRGKGVRLDAVVASGENRGNPRQVAFVSKQAPATTRETARSVKREIVSEPGTTVATNKPQWAIPALWLAALAAATAVLVLTFVDNTTTPTAAPYIVDAGFGLMSDDLHAGNTDTARLVQEAFSSEANGERSRNIELLEAIHRSDRQTPIPAVFLALWNQGTGEALTGMHWIEQARERSTTFGDAYLNLLIDFVEAEVLNNPDLIISRAGALLDIRPNAWRMHHARAHLMEFIGMREAALVEIQQIEVTQLADRKLSTVIADRASFGDIDGAQAMLDKIPASSQPAMHAFLNGRLAWSRGDWDAAHDFWIKAAELAYPKARIDIYRRSLLYAGAIEAAQGRAEAIASLQTARDAIGDHSIIDYTDASLLLAHLHHQAGRTEAMQKELESALAGSAQTQADWIHLVSLFSTWRLWPERAPAKPEQLTEEMTALWSAMENYVGGDLDSARSYLAVSRAKGIAHTRLADEARWLEWKLGVPLSAETPIDPPYPPLVRLLVRGEVNHDRAATETDRAQP